jgi:RNA polymerase sigma-70 factor (ECF subfamily)
MVSLAILSARAPSSACSPFGPLTTEGKIHDIAQGAVATPMARPAHRTALARGDGAAPPADQPLDLVLDRYARGDDAALDDLYRLGAVRVRAFLLRLCADLALADDLTQEAFLRICHARGSFAAGAPALPWMLAIARNAFLDHTRRERVRRAHREERARQSPGPAEAPDGGGDRAVLARQMLGVVQRSLMTLPVRQREAFVLVRFEGLSIAEAAEVLGATPGAVKILAHRAYVVVRAALENEGAARGDSR